MRTLVKIAIFLSTGNLVSQSGLDLQQVSGYTVVAEKINFYRFISHFRMVHRGSFFAELKLLLLENYCLNLGGSFVLSIPRMVLLVVY